jgi:recombination protein RecR
MDNISKIIEIFREFPGIGPRQAKRFAYFLFTKNQNYLENFSNLLKNIKKEVGICNKCFRFFLTYGKNENSICQTCLSKRDSKLLMIISRDVDFENIEKTKIFDGYYFVLGGNIPILEKNPEKKIRQNELLERLQKDLDIKEIILALDCNPDGENTEKYIKDLIESTVKREDIKISHLGRGISTGAELEYLDPETIKNALKNRQ